MAEAFTRHYAGGSIEVASAGTIPSDRVNPVVAQVMLEKGINLSGNEPKLLTAEMAERADRMMTMGCAIEDACPAHVEAEDWRLEDPAGKPASEVRRIRDAVERKVSLLLEEELRSR